MGDKSETRFERLSPIEIAIAGATSGLLTRALIQPFDVLKIRFQLQVEPITKGANSKYNSLLQATSLIYREEGITAFWKGHIPAQILSITFGLIQFWSFETLIKKAKRSNLYENKVVANFVCGATAGTIGTLIVFPLDIIKTRIIAQDNTKAITGLWSGLGYILRNEGYFGLYRGLTPTIIAMAPNTGCQFMFFNLFSDFYKDLLHSDSNVFAYLISGSLAGLCSKMILYPFDMVRKRMQVQRFEVHRSSFGVPFKCGGMSNCFVGIYRNEGIRGYYKGVVPGVYKALVASAVNFTTFETVTKLICSSYKPS